MKHCPWVVSAGNIGGGQGADGHGQVLRGGGAVKRIRVRADVCTGCRTCEVACVARHEGRFGTATARIRVTKLEPSGVDQPHICRLCRRPPCVTACPSEALYEDARTGAILLQPDRCSGCVACVDACPFGMAALHPQTELALICDLCGGDPACVKRCVTGAIVYAESGAGARAKRRQSVGGADEEEGEA